MDQLLIYLGFAFLIWAIYSVIKWVLNKMKHVASEKKHGKNTLIGLAAFVVCMIVAGSIQGNEDANNSSNKSASSSIKTKEASSSSKVIQASSSSAKPKQASSSNEESTSKASSSSEKSSSVKSSSSIKTDAPITASYGELIKSDNYTGKPYQITNAHVMQANEEDGQTALLAYINDDSSKLFLIRLDGKTAAVEDDLINVSGKLDDRTDYDTQIGGSNTVPTIDAKKVTVVGHSED